MTNLSEELYNTELQIREKKRQLARLEKIKAELEYKREQELWVKRGQNPLLIEFVRAEHAS